MQFTGPTYPAFRPGSYPAGLKQPVGFQSGKYHSNVVAPVSLFLFILYAFFTIDPAIGSTADILNIDYRHYAYVLTAAILLHPLEQVIKGGISQLLRADVLLSTSFIYWALLDIFQERFSLIDLSIISVQYSFIYIAAFILVVQVFANYQFLLPGIIRDTSRIDVSVKVLLTVMIVCFLIGLFPFYRSSYYDFAYMLEGLTRPRFSAPWARGAGGGFNAIFEHLKYFGYILPAMSALVIVKERKFSGKVILALALTVFFSAFEFQGGGRRLTGFLSGMGIITYLVAKRHELRLKHLFITGLLGLAVLVLMDMQLTFRNVGYEDMFTEYEYGEFDEIRVDDNFLRIAQMIEHVPERHEFSGTQYLIWAFARPIPRYFWEGKPTSPGFNIAAMVGEPGVALTTTVVGEAYASFGLVMIILVGILYGLLAGTLSRMLQQPLGIIGVALYAIGTLALVGGVRSLVDLIIYSYAFLGLLVVYHFLIRGKETRVEA